MFRSVIVDLDAGGVDDAAEVAAYLDACPVLVAAAGLDPDPLGDSSMPVVNIGVGSDGVFTWPLALPYLVRVHGLAPPRELLEHIRAQNHVAPTFTADEVAALRQQFAELG